MASTDGLGRPRRWSRALPVLIAAVVLSSCGPASVAPPIPATGTPAPSINVPLAVSGCTATFCTALGATTVAVTPPTTGVVTTTGAEWTALATPSTNGTLTGEACSAVSCVVGGSSSGRAFLWSIVTGANGPEVNLLTPPSGTSISALACAPSGTCLGVVQETSNAQALFNVATPTSLTPLDLTGPVSSLQCPTATTCVAVIATDAVLDRSDDGGATWTSFATTGAQPASSLSCSSTRCWAVTGGRLVSWSLTATHPAPRRVVLPFDAVAVACLPQGRCVAVGNQHGLGGAQWRGTGGSRAVTLTYVPTPLTSAACGPRYCVATGVTTLVTLRP